MSRRVLVTGGAGFIGSALVRHLVAETDDSVLTIDKLTYAGSLTSLASVMDDPRHVFAQIDIADRMRMEEIFLGYEPDAVVHLAAESHVDRSIDGPAEFLRTNVLGTYHLLEVALKYWSELERPRKERFRFVHVSTDEVYGSLGDEGRFTETTPYCPNSPYSASKASADHLVRAWHHTYGLPTLLANCSNNYGPYQYPEKLIPVVILRGLEGDSIPVYGRGENVRDWLYVEDHVRALLAVLDDGEPGERFNIGGNQEQRNIELVKRICRIMDEQVSDPEVARHEDLIEFVEDRPGHDYRYAIDASKIRAELGWEPRESLETGLPKTIAWYLNNLDWCRHVLQDGEVRERLGLARTGR